MTFCSSKAIDGNRKGRQTVDLEVTGEISASGGMAEWEDMSLRVAFG